MAVVPLQVIVSNCFIYTSKPNRVSRNGLSQLCRISQVNDSQIFIFSSILKHSRPLAPSPYIFRLLTYSRQADRT